ncbi:MULTISPECIES: integrase family protein [Acidovorax]|uniref:Tyrosine-type recombinase/integrase n=1 Tax=Acidovorax facilis TaxID=12917 RepID=A0ABV8D450_9BURK|nr:MULTISPECIES: integrase family protein [Acidovorax]KQB56021.1 integrase [Acidovorax sp. SD340]MBO1006316.1 integrase family protein [Acidovorax sp. SD340]MCO4240640.1 integrase family protein [Acidovorax facilis]
MAKIAFTAGRVSGFKCPPDKKQAFMWDVTAPGLGLRATPAGKPAYVFQSVYQGKDIRLTIGSPTAWSIPAAQAKARELQRLIDEGKDPRDLKRDALAAQAEKLAAAAAKVQADKAKALTVGEVWPLYLENGRPKRKEAWKPGYRADLEAMAAPGGEKKKRGQGTTRPGPLYPLLALPLAGVNEDTLKSWYDREAVAGKHQAARALMMFRGFLRWCAARPEYRNLTDRDAGKAAAIVENLPSNTRRTDALEAAQVPGWWVGVEQLSNRTASAYLRALLLTGARREELAALTWANVDFQWRKLTIADKVDTTRTIPLSPYVAHMLATLPRVGPFVFASTGKAGRITDTRNSHAKALQSAAIEGLTIHGLRRSFSLLGEAAGAPAGAIAQVMGHKPSATAEGYRPRSIDALRPFLEQIEAHILSLTGVQFDSQAAPGALRAVA